MLQYLLLYGYCFKQCLHCQKYFATKEYEQVFCKRKSPFKELEKFKKPKEIDDFKKLECKEAVKYIKNEFLSKERNAVYHNLYAKYGSGSERLYRFEEACAMLRSLINKKPNIQNLKLYTAFLTCDEVRNNYYSAPGNTRPDKQKP